MANKTRIDYRAIKNDLYNLLDLHPDLADFFMDKISDGFIDGVGVGGCYSNDLYGWAEEFTNASHLLNETTLTALERYVLMIHRGQTHRNCNRLKTIYKYIQEYNKINTK